MELGLRHFVIFPIGISTTDLSEVVCYALHLKNPLALTIPVHHAKQYVQCKCTFLQFHQKTDPWDHVGQHCTSGAPLCCAYSRSPKAM